MINLRDALRHVDRVSVEVKVTVLSCINRQISVQELQTAVELMLRAATIPVVPPEITVPHLLISAFISDRPENVAELSLRVELLDQCLVLRNKAVWALPIWTHVQVLKCGVGRAKDHLMERLSPALLEFCNDLLAARQTTNNLTASSDRQI